MNNQNREDYVDFNDQEYENTGFEDQGAAGYQDPGYDDPGLADDAAYEDEDFPEPGQAPDGGKKKLSPAMMAGAGALALTLVLGAGYYFTMGEEGGGMPDIMAMVTGESSGGESGEVPADAPPEGEPVPVEDEAAPPPKPAKPAEKPKPKPKPVAAKPANDGWSEPVKVDKKPAKPAAKPKPAVAAKPKPAEKPKPAVAAKPKPIPAKPKPAAVAAGGARPVGAGSAHSSVSFAQGSYWVAAADMEKLWSFSTALKTNAGRITVEAHPGSEPNAAELARKRADRVAELIRKNNVGNRFDVNVKIGKGAPGTGTVDVYYSRQL